MLGRVDNTDRSTRSASSGAAENTPSSRITSDGLTVAMPPSPVPRLQSKHRNFALRLARNGSSACARIRIQS